MKIVEKVILYPENSLDMNILNKLRINKFVGSYMFPIAIIEKEEKTMLEKIIEEIREKLEEGEING